MSTAKNTDVKDRIKGGLIVSCQGLDDEPMHSSFIMGRFALAAQIGGAVGIRANTTEDIHEIKSNVQLPVIGIIKKVYDGSDVYITPTKREADELAREGVDIIALDATMRKRPAEELDELVGYIREKYDVKLMADIATFEEAKNAERLGFDFIGTTLRGYTAETKGISIPDFDFIEKLARELDTPIIAEGGIEEPWQLKRVLECGAHCAVIGGAITRPQNITKRFVKAIG